MNTEVLVLWDGTYGLSSLYEKGKSIFYNPQEIKTGVCWYDCNKSNFKDTTIFFVGIDWILIGSKLSGTKYKAATKAFAF